jgi:hypothetical protein
MPQSPIAAVLKALEALDGDAFMSLFGGAGRLLLTDGTVAEGSDEVRSVIRRFMDDLSAMTYQITSEWHPEDEVWIAEIQATYDLKDHGRRGPYPRVMVVRSGSDGIVDLRIYGRHELPLTESPIHYREVSTGGRWLATL